MTTRYYDVVGATRREWLESMRRNAPTVGLAPPSLGSTHWELAWGWEGTRPAVWGCELLGARVDLTIRFTMPQLLPNAEADSADIAEWHRFLTSLWRHEEGHAKRGTRAANAIRELFQRRHTGTCAQVSPMLRFKADSITRFYSKSSQDYDTATRHGLYQGVVLIPFAGYRVGFDTSYRDLF